MRPFFLFCKNSPLCGEALAAAGRDERGRSGRSGRIKINRGRQNKGMRKIRPNPLGKTREERETCFPEAGRGEVRP